MFGDHAQSETPEFGAAGEIRRASKELDGGAFDSDRHTRTEQNNGEQQGQR